jgi:quaternary ammonium compound-resistance protein SugE
MTELANTTSLAAYAQIALATLFNLVTVYCLKRAEGFSRLWPSVVALVTICLTQWLLSRAMASGLEIGLAVATLVVCVMIGAALMGVVLFHEPVSALKAAGFGIAVLGVHIASVAKAA